MRIELRIRQIKFWQDDQPFLRLEFYDTIRARARARKGAEDLQLP